MTPIAPKEPSLAIPQIKNVVPSDLQTVVENVDALVSEFVETFAPLEAKDVLNVYVDARTNARFCECHIRAEKLIVLGTIDVPLDPEEQGE
jgi:hypothetical protein